MKQNTIKITEKQYNELLKHNPYQRSETGLYFNKKTLEERILQLPRYPHTQGQHRIFYKTKKIHETLTKTFPTLKTKEYVEKEVNRLNLKGSIKFFINDFDEVSLGINHNIADSVNVVIDDYIMTQELYNILIKSFEFCGYYLSNEYWSTNTNEFVTQFEPKYQDMSYNHNEIGNYIYHVTTPSFFQKIQKQGFIPKSRNKNYNYPPRCYFFTVNDKALMRWFMIESGKLKGGQDCVILTLDTSKIKNDVKFWMDKLFDSDIAVYTYDNIPFSAIVDAHTYTI